MRNGEVRLIAKINGEILKIDGFLSSWQSSREFGICGADEFYQVIIRGKSTIETEEKKKMSVKIISEPKEVSIEELKQLSEVEQVIIYVDMDKKLEIENKYGIVYGLIDKNEFDSAELKFMAHFLKIGSKAIPYEIIEKIEVVEG